ncbi:RHS repeat-associated core domain-containing protein [Nonomuraea lactucae]|uniref:RHS repeat-associated core domain-containing protein n=1 Tax=Nonomuraea lactucae TaxID=2249762 RepID=UPI000DE35EEB
MTPSTAWPPAKIETANNDSSTPAWTTTSSPSPTRAAPSRAVIPQAGLLSVQEGANPAAGALTDIHDDLIGTFSGTALASSTAYNPFGEALTQTGVKSSLGYQSEYTDPDTGDVNMHARWYQPGTGTFISRDTWTLSPTPSIQANRYTYANGGPPTRTDPSGHQPRPDGGVTIHLGSRGGAGAPVGPPAPYESPGSRAASTPRQHDRQARTTNEGRNQ